MANAPNANLAAIVSALNQGLHTQAFFIEEDDQDEKSFRFVLDESFFTNVLGSAPTQPSSLHFGAGASLTAGTGDFGFRGALNLSGVIGLDLTQSASLAHGLFLRQMEFSLVVRGLCPTLTPILI